MVDAYYLLMVVVVVVVMLVVVVVMVGLCSLWRCWQVGTAEIAQGRGRDCCGYTRYYYYYNYYLY